MQVAIGLLVVLAGTSIMFTQSVLPSVRADGQARRLVSLLQYARETAISSRRDIEVRIDDEASVVRLFRRDAGVEILMETFVFEFGARFVHFPDLGDTPEGYGDESAVDFGNSTTLLYDAEGSLIDETSLPANGTIFVGIGDSILTARAISVTGTTGRPRLYRWRANGTTGGTWGH